MTVAHTRIEVEAAAQDDIDDIHIQRCVGTKIPCNPTYAFLNGYQLVLVIIRGSVTHIEEGAFAGCDEHHHGWVCDAQWGWSLFWGARLWPASRQNRTIFIQSVKSRISEQFSPFVQHRARNDCVVIERSEWVSEESSFERSFVFQVAQNHGKRYSELPKFKSDTLQHLYTIWYSLFIYVCVQTLECMSYFMVLAAIWIAGCCLIPTFAFSSLGHSMPNWKDSRCSTLSPKGFPLVFVCAVMSTASSPHEARTGYQVLQILLNELVCTYVYIYVCFVIVDAAMPQTPWNEKIELRKTIPMSQRALLLIWILPASHLHPDMPRHAQTLLFLKTKTDYFCMNLGVNRTFSTAISILVVIFPQIGRNTFKRFFKCFVRSPWLLSFGAEDVQFMIYQPISWRFLKLLYCSVVELDVQGYLSST